MVYTINEIARLAGVTTRTIRYYDQIGLLPAAQLGKNGYRYYDRSSLIMLQQILFFRELDVPLKEIQTIIAMPDFNPVDALHRHKKALEKRANRIAGLVATIDKTINWINGKEDMAEHEILNGFDEDKYAEEAKTRWGETDSYKESTRKWNSYSQDQKNAIKEEVKQLTVCVVGTGGNIQPNDPDVQKAVGDYLAHLNKHFYTCDAEFLRRLADMWVADARFAINYESIREGGAQFVRDAVYVFCDNQQ